MKAWRWENFFRYLTNTYLLRGAVTTVWLAAAAMGIGLVLGLIAALMLMSKNPVLKGVARLYTWVWRATPLLVQMVIIYTGLPQVGLKLTVVQSALAGLGINEGAYLAEIVRAGILSVGSGQSDAARALAMPYPAMMRLVILPQAMRVFVPALGNRVNGMLKTTSITSVISMAELTRRSQLLIQERFAVLEIYAITTMYYLFMVSVWNRVQDRIEAHYGKAYAEVGEIRGATEAR
jgi:polar amino acid transport system permease protein